MWAPQPCFVLSAFRITVTLSALALCSCAVIDSSIDGRINAINKGYDSAVNDEILANIIHASRHEALRFYQHSKIVPTQTTAFNLGLPTITLGPDKVAAAKEYAFSGSVADNSAGISLEVDPVETHDFNVAVLAPIQPGSIGLLLQSFPKELVYLALFDSIIFQEVATPKKPASAPIEYRNTPTLNDSDCDSDDYTSFYSDTQPVPSVPVGQKGYHATYFPSDNDIASTDDKFQKSDTPKQNLLFACRYRRFQFWVEYGIRFGLTVSLSGQQGSAMETGPAPGAGQPKDSTAGTQKSAVVGYFCLDPAEANIWAAPYVKNNTCNSPSAENRDDHQNPKKPTVVDMGPDDSSFKFGPSSKKATVDATVEIRPRSLTGVYNYLGSLIDHGGLVPVYSPELAMDHPGQTELLTITTAKNVSHCYASAKVDGVHYCVPDDAVNTKRLFALVAQLQGLSSNSTDTPGSLTFRVTP